MTEKDTSADGSKSTTSQTTFSAKDGWDVPKGPYTKLPSDPKEYLKLIDWPLMDQLLHACGLENLSLLNGANNPKIDWKANGEKNGVKMYYASTPGTPNYFFKGVCRDVPVPARDLEVVMRKIENLKLLDPMVKITNTVKTIDTDRHIYYAQFALGGRPVVSDRDFSWYTVDHTMADGTYISCGKSIVVSDCPDDKGHVRGEIFASGYVVQPNKGKEDKECTVSYVVQTDLKGMLPTWLVNWIAQSQAYNPGVIKEKAPDFIKLQKKLREDKDKQNTATNATAATTTSTTAAATPSTTPTPSAPAPASAPATPAKN